MGGTFSQAKIQLLVLAPELSPNFQRIKVAYNPTDVKLVSNLLKDGLPVLFVI